MFLYSTASRFLCVWFRRNARRCACGSHAPMIKHPGQMPDLPGANLFHAAQRQIVILRAFKADAKPAYAADQVSSVNAEVRHEVLRQKKLGVPIGFEIWIGTPAPG